MTYDCDCDLDLYSVLPFKQYTVQHKQFLAECIVFIATWSRRSRNLAVVVPSLGRRAGNFPERTAECNVREAREFRDVWARANPLDA